MTLLGAGCVYVLYCTAAFVPTKTFWLQDFLLLIILIRKYVCKPMKTSNHLNQHFKIMFKADGKIINKK